MFERALEFGADGEFGERALYGSAVVGRRIGSLPGPEVLDRYRRALVSARARGDRQAKGCTRSGSGRSSGAMGESAGSWTPTTTRSRCSSRLRPGGRSRRVHVPGRGGDVRRSLGRVARARRARPPDRAGLAGAGPRDHGPAPARRRAVLDGRCRAASRTSRRRWSWRARTRGWPRWPRRSRTSATGGGSSRARAPAASSSRRVCELSQSGRLANQGRWSRTHLLLVASELGDWDLVLALAGELLMPGADKLDASLAVLARAERYTMLLRRIRLGDRGPREDRALAEGTHELQSQAPAFGYAAEHARRRATPRPRAAIERLVELTDDAVTVYRASVAPVMVRLAVADRRAGGGERFVAPLVDLPSMREHLHADGARAVLDEARGAADAADRYRDVRCAGRRTAIPRRRRRRSWASRGPPAIGLPPSARHRCSTGSASDEREERDERHGTRLHDRADLRGHPRHGVEGVDDAGALRRLVGRRGHACGRRRSRRPRRRRVARPDGAAERPRDPVDRHVPRGRRAGAVGPRSRRRHGRAGRGRVVHGHDRADRRTGGAR